MRFMSDAQRRAMFARMQASPPTMDVVKPVQINLDQNEIERRLRVNASLLQQELAKLSKIPEDDESTRLRMKHRIANYRRRMSSNIKKLKELGVDVSQYEKMRDSDSIDRGPVQPMGAPMSEGIQSTGDGTSLISSSLSPDVSPDIVSDSLYDVGKKMLGGTPTGIYEGGLAAVMPKGWKTG